MEATRRKPKTPQKESVSEVDGRDTFQTPDYATDIIVPFLPVNKVIWECASGLGKIVNRLSYHGFDVFGTDLQDETPVNFLSDSAPADFGCIVTNTPFSIKKKFYEKCRDYGVPFALLIPADYSGWIIDAVRKDGAEKIIPTRRIDYITPNTLKRIWEGETWEIVKKEKDLESPLIDMEMYIDSFPIEWQWYLVDNDRFRFDSIYDAPSNLLRKYSSSYFHSMWLTRGLNLGRSETFVELTNEMKDNI